MLNETHDPALRSWVPSANDAGSDFPIQNLPYGVFRRAGSDEPMRIGVAIGDQVLDLAAACARGAFSSGFSRDFGDLGGATQQAARHVCAPTLNALMAQKPAAWSALRRALSRLLRDSVPEAERLHDCLLPQGEAEFGLPAHIGDYTDFFTSQYHALNAGRLFQPDNPVLPNFKCLPIGYHGRSSSIAITGTNLQRPWGQVRTPGATAPVFEPTQRLDYELELGVFIGAGNRLGEPIAIDEAEDHAFGLCLLNDWSARDVQAWEAVPLGPFLAKNFFTTISPWVVTLEALAPFRCPLPREASDPATLPGLWPHGGHVGGAIDIQLEARLVTPRTGSAGLPLTRTSYRHAYWSVAQMIAHHTENGCNVRPGDLLGTGTRSGPTHGEEGCLLELARGGQDPLHLPNGETRSFLHDGDTVVLRGWCERPGQARIGLGECRGTVLAARAAPARAETHEM